MLCSTLPTHPVQGMHWKASILLHYYMPTKQMKHGITVNVILTAQVSRESQVEVAPLCGRFPNMTQIDLACPTSHHQRTQANWFVVL
jgi:hypothetical protein